MSNLKLPALTYDNLSKVLGNRAEKKIGYETRARRVDAETIDIIHHSTVIAELTDNMVYIPAMRYNSSTTSQRIHRVLVDTGAYLSSGYTLAIRQGLLSLVHRDKLNKPLGSLSLLGDLQWNLGMDGTWSLAPTDAQKSLLAA